MNALKHAFHYEKPDAAIVVSYKVAGTNWKLTISDNGIGKPDVKASEIKEGSGPVLSRRWRSSLMPAWILQAMATALPCP